MSFNSTKCGKKTIHLQAKDTGKHFVKLMTCNKLDCPNCQPIVSARIKKKIRYYAQHDRLVFFNTITSKNGFDDLESIFKKIRKDISNEFTIEGYMKRKKVSYDKALIWYEKKKKKIIESDALIELERISRQDAIIHVAKSKNVFYKRLSEKEKRLFKFENKESIHSHYEQILESNLNNQSLKNKIVSNIIQRFVENEHVDFKFIRVIEFHKSGQPHYHFLTNRYISHTLLKKLTVEGVSEVYDNTYILEDAMKRNSEFESIEDVNTDAVAAYVSKITDYVTKDTIETYTDLKKNKGFKKKLISSSDSIKLTDENSDDNELKHRKIGVFDYILNATNYEVPDYQLNDIEGFIKDNSIKMHDPYSVQAVKQSEDMIDAKKYNFIIAERLKHIAICDFTAPVKKYLIDGLTDEQLSLIKMVNESKLTILIGRAGTGKSYTITNLLKALNPNPSTTFVMTYTGKASSRLRELFQENNIPFYKPVTIHKACSSSFNGNFLKNEENILNCEYLIIDEVSMIPREILAKLLLAVPSYVKVLFAGDDAQLPPVNDVSIIPELKQSEFVRTVELTKVFRSGDAVLNKAHNVLNGKLIDYEIYNDDNLSPLVKELISKGYQILTNTKKMTKQINMIAQEGKSHITRCFNDFRYDLGDWVMIVANSSPREVSNGDTGIIISSDENGLIIKLDTDGREVFYKYEDTEEITPAYAFTVHKSQGSEYEKVAVILEEQVQLNTNNLLYTAITRAKSDVKVYVPNEITMNCLISNKPKNDNFITIQNVYDFVHNEISLKGVI